MSVKRARIDGKQGSDSDKESEEELPKPEVCSICMEGPLSRRGFRVPSKQRVCRHQIDPKNRIYHQLTVGMHWTNDKAIAALDAYAKFLTLKVLEQDFNPNNIQLSPTDLLDQVWHAHVLDTAAYEACNEFLVRHFEKTSSGSEASRQRTRRHFIHHDPIGAFDQEARKKTWDAYIKHFGHTPDVDDEAWAFPVLTGYHFVTFKLRDSFDGLWITSTKSVRLDVPVASLIPDICDDLDLDGLDLDELRIYDGPGESIPRLTATLGSLQRIQKKLANSSTLQVCLMTEGEVRELQAPPTTNITIRTLTGKSLRFAVHLTPGGETVGGMKERIRDRDGQQWLIFGGKRLEDDHDLSDYGITNESRVDLIRNVRGC